MEYKDERVRPLLSRSSQSKWGDKHALKIPITSFLKKQLTQRTLVAQGKEGLPRQGSVSQQRGHLSWGGEGEGELLPGKQEEVQPGNSSFLSQSQITEYHDLVLSQVRCSLASTPQTQRWGPERGPSSWLLSFYRQGNWDREKQVSTWGFNIVYLGDSCHLFPPYCESAHTHTEYNKLYLLSHML